MRPRHPRTAQPVWSAPCGGCGAASAPARAPTATATAALFRAQAAVSAPTPAAAAAAAAAAGVVVRALLSFLLPTSVPALAPTPAADLRKVFYMGMFYVLYFINSS